MRLNGWRRLAVVFFAASCMSALSVAAYEVLAHRGGYFVGHTPLRGTVVRGNKATLPSGEVIELNVPVPGEIPEPWELDWDNQPQHATETYVRWSKLFSVAFALPLAAWACLEFLAVVANWVLRGFRERNLLVAKKELRAWALAHPYVKKVWIYGSRAKGTPSPCSDLDVAIEIDPVGNDEDAYTSFVSEHQKWHNELQPQLPYTLHLEWYDPTGRNAVVQCAVNAKNIVIYERNT